MSTKPRVIATTASAALLAGATAAGAVVALDTLASTEPAVAGTTQSDQAPSLASPKDDSATVYQQPGSSSGSGRVQPAPPSTSWNTGGGNAGKGSTSHSS